MVLRELTKALDDPKRAVRKEAVDARFVYRIPFRRLTAYFTPLFAGQAGLRTQVRRRVTPSYCRSGGR